MSRSATASSANVQEGEASEKRTTNFRRAALGSAAASPSIQQAANEAATDRDASLI